MLHLFEKDKSKTIHMKDIDAMIGKIELIDIRDPFEYDSGSIQTAKNIPLNNLLEAPERYLVKDKIYYVMCQSGVRSRMASKTLRKQGFDIIEVAGGMSAYTGTKRV